MTEASDVRGNVKLEEVEGNKNGRETWRGGMTTSVSVTPRFDLKAVNKSRPAVSAQPWSVCATDSHGYEGSFLFLTHECSERVSNGIKRWYGDFPGGAVVKNPPVNAGDTGSSPGPGRSHMLRSS